MEKRFQTIIETVKGRGNVDGPLEPLKPQNSRGTGPVAGVYGYVW